MTLGFVHNFSEQLINDVLYVSCSRYAYYSIAVPKCILQTRTYVRTNTMYVNCPFKIVAQVHQVRIQYIMYVLQVRVVYINNNCSVQFTSYAVELNRENWLRFFYAMYKILLYAYPRIIRTRRLKSLTGSYITQN